MKPTALYSAIVAITVSLTLAGCPPPPDKGLDSPKITPTNGPRFSLAWSEYPSWSTFGVAHEKQLISGAPGKAGPIEREWNVDIELKEADYDPCIQMYNTGACDAVCMTNMDSLNPSLSQTSVAICPTSTSIGADACLIRDFGGLTNVELKDQRVANLDDVKALTRELRNHKVYGLAKSVSEYCFVRNLELLGETEGDHDFTNMDPGAAATAFQIGSPDHKAIVVWNPYVLQTLKTTPEGVRLFDSTTIPEEIIDMVVVTKASLDRPGGKRFACAVIETYYELNKLLEGPVTRDATLVALGEKFSDLKLQDMKKVVTETKFYSTPEAGLQLFKGGGFFTEQKFTETMQMVVDFCKKHEIVPEEPTIFFGSTDEAAHAQLIFDPTYMEMVKDQMEK
jgi:NitT/TauT family transport system substrate-binding protein